MGPNLAIKLEAGIRDSKLVIAFILRRLVRFAIRKNKEDFLIEKLAIFQIERP